MVVGSANLDIVMALPRFPLAGETVMGGRLEEACGGKGLNQAVAAGRTATTAFVGCVGNDEAGHGLVDHLDRAGVDTSYVVRRAEPTGRAFIQVTPEGENSIVVMSLANSHLDAAAVTAALMDFVPDLVLAQLEVPVEAVAAAAQWTQSNGSRFVLNPSPVRELPWPLLEQCDPLVVNALEARAVLQQPNSPGHDSAPGSQVRQLSEELAGRIRSVVVTHGSGGAFVATAQSGSSHVAGMPVAAVDTTGAGDEFAGTLTAGLAHGMNLERAAEAANESAARLVQVPRKQR